MPFHPNTGVAPAACVASPPRAPLAFHAALPGYRPTPLRPLPDLAGRLGIGGLWVKDESRRLGLPAFKVLGASWAVARLLAQRLGIDEGAGDPGGGPTPDLEALKAALRPHLPLTLLAATDGNHGRAVARVAAWLGLGARIFVPAGTAPARIAAIAGEGADVEGVDGGYDRAVARAAQQSDARHLLVQDGGAGGGEPVPQWVAEGYLTLFWEVEDQLRAAGEALPDLALVQLGVGALAQASVMAWRRPGLSRPPRLVGVEPDSAACVLAALAAGAPVPLPGEQHSVMAGLNCGTASAVAFPWLRAGLDGVVTVRDELALEAMRLLAQAGVESGETGAAGLAGLLELLEGSGSREARERLDLDADSRVLLLSTEGATDPQHWRLIVGQGARPANG